MRITVPYVHRRRACKMRGITLCCSSGSVRDGVSQLRDHGISRRRACSDIFGTDRLPTSPGLHLPRPSSHLLSQHSTNLMTYEPGAGKRGFLKVDTMIVSIKFDSEIHIKRIHDETIMQGYGIVFRTSTIPTAEYIHHRTVPLNLTQPATS